ncbi:MAG: hypothetical protein WBN79_13230, partial [Gemmatimonadota bacterium]
HALVGDSPFCLLKIAILGRTELALHSGNDLFTAIGSPIWKMGRHEVDDVMGTTNNQHLTINLKTSPRAINELFVVHGVASLMTDAPITLGRRRGMI